MRREFINKIIAVAVISTTLCTLVPVSASAEWVTDYQNNWYYTQDGRKLTGWKKIDGNLYYFDGNGKMQTGWISSGSSYYFLQNNGVLKTGWFKYGKDWYYSNSTGVMQTGTINISGKIYMLGDNGILKTSNTVINGEFYTIGSDGVVAGTKVPTPDKEFDDSGNVLSVLRNTDNKTTVSPTYSSYSDVIKDESVSDDDPNQGRTFKVRYKDSNGADLKVQSIKNGKTVDLYTPTKDSYNFSSWNTKSDGSGKKYAADDSIKVQEDINLYAQWSKDAAVLIDGLVIKGSSYVTVNKTTQMKVEISPSDATNTSVVWSVTDGTGKATIDSNGVLTGTVAGTVTVKATANDRGKVSITKDVTVSVADVTVPVSKISIGSKTGLFAITANGGTLQMTTSVYPDNANNQEVTWSVDEIAGSASIDPVTGLLTAKSDGVVTVKATAKDGSGIVGSTTVKISGQTTKISVTSVEITGKTVIDTDIALGGTNGTLQVDAKVLPATASNKAITWSIVEGSDFAKIDSAGLITAKANGTIKVQAKANETGIVSNQLEITISNQSIKVTGIKINNPGIISSSVPVQLTAVTSPAGASVKSVKWTVENKTGSATITETGILSPLSNGTVAVKAIATAIDGTSISDSLDVTMSGITLVVPATSIDKVYGQNTGQSITSSITKDDGILQMHATVLPSYASDTEAAVKWSVIGSGASIDPDTGILTAVSNGKVTVRATCIANTKIFKDGYLYISGQITQADNIIIKPESTTGSAVQVAVGGTLQMTAVVEPTEATYPNVTWYVKSGNPGTADINATSGLLTGKSVGKVTVVAVADNGAGIEKEQIVEIISPVKVTKVTVEAPSGSLNQITTANGTLQMSKIMEPTTATNQLVTWSVEQAGDTGTSMTGKATINASTGVLTAVANGTVNVKATANDGSKIVSDSVTITISGQTVKATGYTLTGTRSISGLNTVSTTIDQDDGTLTMLAAILPLDSTTTPASIIWSVEPYTSGPLKSAGSAAIAVDSNKIVTLTALTNGDVKVKATGTTTDNRVISGEYIVSLSGQIVKVATIEVKSSTLADSLLVGKTMQMTANILPATATTKGVTWSVVDFNGTGTATHAAIGTDGKLTGVSQGTVTVTATATDGTAIFGTANITIN